jgi:hypothetical protein
VDVDVATRGSKRRTRGCAVAPDAGTRRATRRGRRGRKQPGCAGRDDRGANTGSASLCRRHLPHAGAGGGRQRAPRGALHAPHLAREPLRPGGGQPGWSARHRAVHAADRRYARANQRLRAATCASCARPSAATWAWPRRPTMPVPARSRPGSPGAASFRPRRRLTS